MMTSPYVNEPRVQSNNLELLQKLMEESNDDEKSIVAQWKEYFNRLDEYTKNGSIDRVEDIKLERDILRTALLNIVTKNAEKGMNYFRPDDVK